MCTCLYSDKKLKEKQKFKEGKNRKLFLKKCEEIETEI